MSEIKVSIYKRSAESPFYHLQYRDPISGRKRRKSSGCKTKRDAERAAAKWEAELRAGNGQGSSRMSWGEFRRLYEDEALSALAEGTAHKVCGIFNVLEELLSPKRLQDISEQAISRYANELRKSGRAEATISAHMAHLKAALNWAADNRHIAKAPKVRMPRRARKGKLMKGRPVTGEELERMISKIESVLFGDADDEGENPNAEKIATTASWERLLWGLWWSGLRIGEAMQLHWDDLSKIRPIDLDSAAPMLMIPGEHEKGNTDRLLPMAPEFAEYLRETPLAERSGYVFDLKPRRHRYAERLTMQHVSRTICRFGEAACVRVSEGRRRDAATGEVVTKNKFASAHDLRRSFGERWSRRVLPQVLQEMMRHETIQTTLKYYVGQNAKRSAADIWAAYGKRTELGATLGTSRENADSGDLQESDHRQ